MIFIWILETYSNLQSGSYYLAIHFFLLLFLFFYVTNIVRGSWDYSINVGATIFRVIRLFREVNQKTYFPDVTVTRGRFRNQFL